MLHVTICLCKSTNGDCGYFYPHSYTPNTIGGKQNRLSSVNSLVQFQLQCEAQVTSGKKHPQLLWVGLWTQIRLSLEQALLLTIDPRCSRKSLGIVMVCPVSSHYMWTGKEIP